MSLYYVIVNRYRSHKTGRDQEGNQARNRGKKSARAKQHPGVGSRGPPVFHLPLPAIDRINENNPENL
jgi:hypothetical protein